MQTNPRWITAAEALQDISAAGAYIDVVLGPVELENASTPYQFLPDPSDPSDLIIYLFSHWEWLPASECYNDTFTPVISYSVVGQPLDGGGSLDLQSKDYAQVLNSAIFYSLAQLDPSYIGIGQGLSVSSNENPTGGNGIVKGRIFYILIKASTLPATPAFFTITALDQESKTFSVNGDATVLGATFSVVGNTGDPTNNGTYTKVSATGTGTPRTIIGITDAQQGYQVAGDRTAEFPVDSIVFVADRPHADDDGYRKVNASTFDVDHTDINLTYTPDHDEAGGTIMRSATDVVVNEAIPDSTADGWLKQ